MYRNNDTIFSDPARVIEFGLVEVLKYMVEEGIISPNAYHRDDCNRIAVELDSEYRDPLPLLFIAAKSMHNASCLRYLLSLDNLDTNARFSRNDIGFSEYTTMTNDTGFVHFILHRYRGNTGKPFPHLPVNLIRSIVNDSRFDINLQITGGWTPLRIL